MRFVIGTFVDAPYVLDIPEPLDADTEAQCVLLQQMAAEYYENAADWRTAFDELHDKVWATQRATEDAFRAATISRAERVLRGVEARP